MSNNQNAPMYLISKLAPPLRPGEPIRLFPFGTVHRNGQRRELTPELARRFKLPHFKPPIKFGSHEEGTRAGGYITGLEVRADGLYMLPEFTDDGQQALARGDYRYHSPEVVWEGVWGEDSTTGEKLEGPLILGVALLHTPALGEAAALFSVEPYQQQEIHIMSEQTVQVPAGLWDRFTSWLDGRMQDAPTPEQEPPTPDVVPDALTAALKESTEKIQQLTAKIDTMEAEKQAAARVAHFAGQLTGTPLAGAADMHTLLAGLTDEQAAPIVQQFKALAAQVDETQLTATVGSSGNGNPADAFEAVVTKVMEERKLARPAAYSVVLREQPQLFTEAINE